jgi:PTS system nitrogen regulatory IIA component
VKTVKNRSGLVLQAIDLNVAATSHVEVLRRLGAMAAECCPSLEPGVVTASLLARERLGSTMLIPGIALPHARLAGLNTALVCAARLTDDVTVDDGRLSLAVCILVPEDDRELHLDLLGHWASLLRKPDRVSGLLSASNNERFLALAEEVSC